MDAEPAPIRLLREILDSTIGANKSTSFLTRALAERGGRAPTSHEELMDLASGPLRRLIDREVGSEAARGVVRRIEEVLIAAEAPTGRHGVVPQKEAQLLWPEQDRDTQVVRGIGGGLRLVVLSATDALGDQVRNVLAMPRLRVRTIETLPAFEEMAARRLDIVVVDGGSPPRIAVEEVVRVLAAMPENIWCIVWGAELDFGHSVTNALERMGRHSVPLSTREGIAPLIDLVRSRGSDDDVN